MNLYLVLRLRNAAIVCDKRKDFALAELLTEVIKELEHGDFWTKAETGAIGAWVDDQGASSKSADGPLNDQRLRNRKEISELLEPSGAGSQT